MKIQKLISAFTAMILMLQIVAAPISAETEPTSYPIRQLMVSGNKIVYEDDPSTMVRLVGTNIPSLGWSTNGKGEHLVESLVESCDGWNSNLIRLPVSPSMWFNETYGAIYKSNINDMVKGAAVRGKYLLLDCHTYVMPTPEVLAFWLDVCDVYGNNPTVLFGLCNEPHDIKGQEEDAGKSQWQLWRDGGKILYNSAVTQGIGHQQLVEAIRDKGAKNILVAGGLGWGYDLKGIAGLAGDGISYALIDQGSNGDTSKTGYGIMYDSHIYPSKGLEPSWDKAAGCVRSFAPLLIGEFGWDSKDPNISNDTSVFNLWVPQLLDWIDDVNNKYGVPANWTAWNLHMASTPRAITGWDFNPTSFLGKYLKERLLSYPPTSYPVTGEYTNNFEPDVFREYTTTVTKNSSISHSITNGALKITYNRLGSATAVEKRLAFPVDWVLDGVQTIELNLKANQGAVTTGTKLEIGFEGSDKELWTKTIPIINTDDNRIVIPVNELRKLVMNARGDDILSNAIRGLYIGVSNTSKGEVLIDNIKITKSATPLISMPAKAIRVPNQPNYLFDMESPSGMLTVSKNDNGPGGSQGDYFRSEVVAGEGFQGSTGLRVSYDRRMGVWGGFTVSKLPAGVNCADAKYVSLCIKGDGQHQNITPKIGTSTPMTIDIPEGDTEWHQYTFKLETLGCELPEDITSVEFHANLKMEGVFWVDNIVVSDVKPTVFIKATPIVYENGFEDSLLTRNFINNSANIVTGKIVDGGYNSQCAYRLDFQKPDSGASATAELLQPSTWNLSGTELFTFDAKSASGNTENISVGLLDKVGIASKLNRTLELTNEWQRYIIPIDDFMLNDRSILTKRIKGLHIQSNSDALTSSILIDNITFSNEVIDPPVPHSVQYKNTFDPDIYAANGGTYEFVGDDGTDYIRAFRKTGKGYNGTGGLVFEMVGNNSGRSVQMKGGFPADWDFSKAKYASVMLKSTNVVASDGKMQNMNKIVMELWNDYTDASGNAKSVKTGTINLDATVGVWSNLIVPIEPNTKDNPSTNMVKGTNRLVIYSALKQTGGFIMDDLAFHDMKPEEVIPPHPAEFRETFDANTMLSIKGGYYVDANNYIFRNDNGGIKHWGQRVQFEYPAGTQAPASGTDYIQGTIPLSWRLARTTHFVCDSRIIGGWRTSDYSNIFAPKTATITQAKVTISLIDTDGAEFKKVLVLTNTSWNSFALPLNEFVNKDGKALDLTKIKYLRLYPDEEKIGGQGGFDMDNIGFKTIVPNYNVSVSNITVIKDGENLAVTGLSKGTATVTAYLSGLGKDVSLFAALYRKSNGTVLIANAQTKDISADGETSSLSVDIDIPDNPQDYQLKVFVWDRTYNTLNPISGGLLEI